MLAPYTLLQNRYRIMQPIGKGGMGAVYLALDQRFGDESMVALKETLFSDERLRKAFEREARLLNSLRHPALPKVTDHFIESNGQYLVMEYIAGDDLSQMMESKGGVFSCEEVLKWADQLLDALDYLHTQQPPIIHRDIKPQNLKLTGRGQIILLDFGLAKGTVGRASSWATSQSVLGFTPNYAPLEQSLRADPHWIDVLSITTPDQLKQALEKNTDARSDIYSLGATLYHLLTGSVPPAAASRALSIWTGRPDPLRLASELNSQVPDVVAELLHRALAQEPEKRPQTAVALRKAIRGVSQILRNNKQIKAASLSPDDDDSADWPTAWDTDESPANEPRTPSYSSDTIESSPSSSNSGATMESTEVFDLTSGARTIDSGASSQEPLSPTAPSPAGNRMLIPETAPDMQHEEQAALRRAEELKAEQRRAEQERERAAEEERKRIEAERRHAEEEEAARLRAEKEAQQKAEEEARLAAEAERRRKAEEQAARLRAEEQERRLAEERSRAEEERLRLEEEARQRAEVEAAQKRAEQEAARLRAAEEARRKAEEEARRLAEEEARRQAEEARRAEEQERLRRAQEARRAEEARLAEEARRAQEEARKRAEEEAARLREEEAARARAAAAALEAARRKAEDEAAERHRVETEARRRREEDEHRRAAEDAARRDAEQRRRAEDEAQRRFHAETIAESSVERAHALMPTQPLHAQPPPTSYMPSPERSRLPLIIGGLVVLLVVGIALFALLRNQGKTDVVSSNVAATPSPASSPTRDVAPRRELKLARTLEGHTDRVWAVALSPDSRMAASASADKSVLVWDTKAGTTLYKLAGHSMDVNSVAFSPDGKTLVSASNDKKIKIWDMEKGVELRTLGGHTDQVYLTIFSADGEMLASAGKDKIIKLWSTKTGAEIRTLSGHTDMVLSISFAPDGKTLASGSRDQTVRVWDTQTGKELKMLNGHHSAVFSVAFSADGKILASAGNDRTVKLWKAENLTELKSLTGHGGYVSSIAFSHDGKTIASGSKDKTVKLWDTQSWALLQTLAGHNQGVNSVAFSTDSKMLVSGSQDGTVKLWE